MDSTAGSASKSVNNLSLKDSAHSGTKGGLLTRGDSGYISPITPASTGSTPSDSLSIRRSLSAANTRVRPTSTGDTKASSSDSSPEVDQSTLDPFIAPISFACPSGDRCKMSGDKLSNIIETEVTQEQSNSYLDTVPQDEAMFQPAHHELFSDFQSNTSGDTLLLAFNCRKISFDWDKCDHPYCFIVRNNWLQVQKCCDGKPNVCHECSKFFEMVDKHTSICSDPNCPVEMCNRLRKEKMFLEMAPDNSQRFHSPNGLVRSQSFTEQTPTAEYESLPPFLSNIYDSTTNSPSNGDLRRYLLRDNNGHCSMTFEMIQAKAEEIVQRMDEEDPLLPPNEIRTSLNGLPKGPGGVGSGPKALSPIYEVPLIPESLPSLGNVSLIQRSQDQHHSYAYSTYDADGILQSVPEEPVYPTQQVIHTLDREYLIPGEDSFYFHLRNYYLNDINDALGKGGYGTCLGGTDNSTSRVFAMKRNNKSDQLMIDSIQSECHVLSGLGHHDHVIQFYGAVIDNEENNIYLPRVCKMFMELADSGNLAELLQLDDGTLSPLPIDQSLYYIEQLLQGVHFLHSNGVLHLDIKAVNVLVFDGGRTVKLADFGTAVKLSEIAAMRGQCVACTPYFAAPEVVLQEQPGFSADVWSVMCVLVELVTTRWPGCHTQRPGCPIQPISHPQMMYLIGKYDRDNDIEKLIPLSKLDLEPDVKELFHMVFVKDRTKRPSALDLLHHPKFMFASNYGRLFDEEYDEEMPEVVSADLSQQDVPMNMEAQAPPTQLRYCGSMNSDLETDHVNGGCDARKRESQDSGTGDEFLNSFDVRGHSGFDTPSSIDKWRSAFSHWGSESTEDTSANLVTKQFESSSSFGGYTSQNSATRTQTQNTHFSHSNLETQTPNAQFTHLSTSNYRLHHSHSAPIISNSFDRRRRSSLQTYHTHSSSCEGSETAGGRPKLRRTSSMVYVDKGPDIDVPDITNVPSIQDLITSVSVLNLDHTHSSSSWQSNGYQGADEGRPHSHQSVPQLTSTYRSVSPNSQLGQTGLTDLSKTRETGLRCLARDGQTGLTGYSTGGNDQGISENTPINTQLAKSEQTSLTGYSRVGNGVISVATPITGKPVQKTVTVYETIC